MLFQLKVSVCKVIQLVNATRTRTLWWHRGFVQQLFNISFVQICRLMVKTKFSRQQRMYVYRQPGWPINIHYTSLLINSSAVQRRNLLNWINRTLDEYNSAAHPKRVSHVTPKYRQSGAVQNCLSIEIKPLSTIKVISK